MKAEIDIRDAMKSTAIVVTIRGMKRLRFRMKVGTALIKIGARVIGCDVELKTVATGGMVKPKGGYVVGENVPSFAMKGNIRPEDINRSTRTH